MTKTYKYILIVAILMIVSTSFAADPTISKINGVTWGTGAGNMSGWNGASTTTTVGGITYIANSGAGNESSGVSVSCAFGASTSAGDLLLVGVASYQTDPPVVGAGTFEDDRGNTWTRIADSVIDSSGADRGAIYSAVAKDTGVVTITATKATGYIVCAVAAFSGTTGTADGANKSTSAAPTTDIHFGNIVTSAAGVVFGHMSHSAAAVTITGDGNWTACPYEQESIAVYAQSMCYRITTASGTFNDGWTLSSTGDGYGVKGAAFK